MTIKETKTSRGFGHISFNDKNKIKCRLQKSSSAIKNKIWLGIYDHEMHLTQKQVKQLLPYLKRFVKTGDIL